MYDEESISSDKNDHRPSRKKAKPEDKKWYKQSFNDAWLKDPELADWISKDPGNKFTVRCKVCEHTFNGPNKSALMKHKATKKHTDAYKAKQNTLQVSKFFQKQTGPDVDEMKAKAEVLLPGFLAEHRTPFLQADHLSELMKKMFPDSKIAQKMQLKRTKASYVVQEGIAREEWNESTDISVSQILAVVVRFYHERKVIDALLTALEVENGTADGLYAAVKNFFQERAIPLSNVVGFAGDNCSTMMGKNGGFQALLKKDVPGVFVFGCICHSFALCAHYASCRLPSWLEAFVKDVCCYFSRSSQRQHQFRLIQDIVEAPRHKVLKLSQTRWLSRDQVVARILEQWDALKLFFQSESPCDRVDGAVKIYATMTTNGTKHIMAFLNYILSKVDRLNAEFQAQDFKLHTLYSSISDEYRSILAMFIHDKVVRETVITL
ncbi:protein ZBED8-like [Xenia sp. Carnegie-2017]|uniref:protein ZBED8-like n=1 Tax=Xenia sp. Carnegie-2017 TaxID=2897299 RepID=UPI001F049111|nr:protein ZBED8-like [Xenia sp. Carnegie-2017]